MEKSIMAWIVRILLYIAAPITVLFVARDALNFEVLQMMVATVLVAALVGIAAFWPGRRKF
ncbi:hypothetical protein HNQ36_005296 [Afipia massiliensis]|uniref:Uncharacterized protein n=1 Tax=Afipia massiliensis TaxID=211460 RepID=A0A840N4H3_9BRAD|nr:hypothetical protein [Afipia massiliensis]MBB5055285.1 hypothetical protein [Afipia massiliensis]